MSSYSPCETSRSNAPSWKALLSESRLLYRWSRRSSFPMHIQLTQARYCCAAYKRRPQEHSPQMHRFLRATFRNIIGSPPLVEASLATVVSCKTTNSLQRTGGPGFRRCSVVLRNTKPRNPKTPKPQTRKPKPQTQTHNLFKLKAGGFHKSLWAFVCRVSRFCCFK